MKSLFKWIWAKLDALMQKRVSGESFEDAMNKRRKASEKWIKDITGIKDWPPPTIKTIEPILKDVSRTIWYGISSEKSQVYHILVDCVWGGKGGISFRNSLCNMADIILEKALDTIPIDKRICKLCKEMMDNENAKVE